MASPLCQGMPHCPLDSAAPDLHSRKVEEHRMASQDPQQMTTAEAVVASLAAHGIDTVYALPGIQNDHLFDALFKAGNRIRTVHTRHEQGSAYMALGAALATGKPQAFAVVNGTGASQCVRGAAHGLFDECAGPGADRRDPGARHRPQHRPSARAARPGGRDRAAGRPFGPDRLDRRCAAPASPRRCARCASGRRGPAALVCPIDVWGASGLATPQPPLAPHEPAIDDDAILAAASASAPPRIR